MTILNKNDRSKCFEGLTDMESEKFSLINMINATKHLLDKPTHSDYKMHSRSIVEYIVRYLQITEHSKEQIEMATLPENINKTIYNINVCGRIK